MRGRPKFVYHGVTSSTLTCQVGDLYRPDLAWPGRWKTWRQIAAEVITGALKCGEWKRV